MALIKSLEKELRTIEQIEKDEADERLAEKLFKLTVDIVPDFYYKVLVGIVGIWLVIYLIWLTMEITEMGLGTAEEVVEVGNLEPLEGEEEGRRLQELDLGEGFLEYKNVS